jgi:hypothetical protein
VDRRRPALPAEPAPDVTGGDRTPLQAGVRVPYFGESGSYVFVGEIRHVWEKPVGHCHWSTGPIVELQRDRVLLRFPQRKAQLNHGRNRPIQSAWDGLVAAAKSFD